MSRVSAVADEVLRVAAAALDPQVANGLRRFTHICRPPDDCCDFLAVWVSNLRPRGGKCLDPLLLDVFVLLRQCWPTLNDQGAPPAGSVLSAATERITENAVAIYQGLALALDGDVPSTLGGFCKAHVPVVMECDQPTADCAGWLLSFTVEVC